MQYRKVRIRVELEVEVAEHVGHGPVLRELELRQSTSVRNRPAGQVNPLGEVRSLRSSVAELEEVAS